MTLSPQQHEQETEYLFPYHYLFNAERLIAFPHKLFTTIDYMSCLKHVREKLGPFEGQKILDAACGEGRYCYTLKKENIRLYGLDYSQKAIEFAKVYNPEIQFDVADLTKGIPHESNCFDQVILIETLEHIDPDHINNAISEIARVLKPSGKLIITVPHRNRKLSTKHYQHFSSDSLEQCLSQNFKINEMYGFHRTNFWHNLILKIATGIYYYLYPLKKIGLSIVINTLTKLAYSHFNKHLRLCSADEGLTLIGIATKK